MKKFSHSSLVFAVLNTCFAFYGHAQPAIPTSYFKTIFLADKKDGMSFPAFDRYQMQRHVPLVLEIPDMSGYSVNMAMQPEAEPPCSLYVELWFKDAEVFQQAMASEAAATAIADQPNLLEKQATMIAVKEYLLKAPPPRQYTEASGLYKATFFAVKKASMSHDEYVDYQLKTHAPLVLDIPGLRGYEVNIVQHAVAESEYDAVVHVWFDDAAAFEAGMASAQAQRAIADQANFLETEALQMMIVDERMIRAPEGLPQAAAGSGR